jgi:hypothetical protein
VGMLGEEMKKLKPEYVKLNLMFPEFESPISMKALLKKKVV